MIRAVLGRYVPITWGGKAQAGVIADDLAEMYPGSVVEWVPRQVHGGGYWEVSHPDAEGLPVTHYNDTILPDGTTLQRRDSVREGDTVSSSHVGTRVVRSASTRGQGAGTTYLVLEVSDTVAHTEAAPGDALIPVVARAVQPDVLPLTADEVLVLIVETRRRSALDVEFPVGGPVLRVTPGTEWAREFVLSRRATVDDVVITAQRKD